MYSIHVIDTSMHPCIGTLCQGGKVPIPRRSFKTTSEGAAGRHFHQGKGYKFPPKKKNKTTKDFIMLFVPTSQGRVAGTCAHMGTTALLLVTVRYLQPQKRNSLFWRKRRRRRRRPRCNRYLASASRWWGFPWPTNKMRTAVLLLRWARRNGKI